MTAKAGKCGLWAITSYFNPMGYRTRRENYFRFRRNLSVPLITVELSFTGNFELDENDADIVIRVSGGAILWQKERLLNIALDALPDSADYVAWLDCDILLERDDWALQAINSLQTKRVVQLFSELVDLEAGEAQLSAAERSSIRRPVSGQGIASLLDNAIVDPFCHSPQTTEQMRKRCIGLAWASTRETLQKHGFYDAMVVGGGDTALLRAMCGRFEDVREILELNPCRMDHYLDWAVPFYATVKNEVGCVPGRLYHLWHGAISDRHYKDRYSRFAAYDFGPYSNLEIGQGGAWQLRSVDPGVAEFLREYFRERREDG